MKKIFVKKSIKILTVCAGIMAMLMGTAPAYAYTRLNEDQMIHQELIADMTDVDILPGVTEFLHELSVHIIGWLLHLHHLMHLVSFSNWG